MDNTQGNSNEPRDGKNEGNKSPHSEPQLSAETIEEIESAFENFAITTMAIEGYEFDLIGLNELPMSKLMKLMHVSGRSQIELVHEYIQLCLVNPKQFEIVESLDFGQFNFFMKAWLQISQQRMAQQMEMDIEEKDYE